MSLFIGVDVGTSSARAGLVQKTPNGGKLLKHHVEEIKIFKPLPGQSYFEQSSDDIWEKVCKCIRAVTSEVVDKSEIKGIGFDATCSLVLLDKNNQPLTASPSKKSEQNIIMWMDHRAQAEAEFINSLNHDILKFVGGKVSLEMEIPKLLWLKKNLSNSFNQIHQAFDLPDFLTFKATGKSSRSICSLTCKWNYDAVNGKFTRDYFDSIGLSELAENNFSKIGNEILEPGEFAGSLSEEAANEMGLVPGIAIGASMIDAHAGALGLIGSSAKGNKIDVSEKLVLIAGTSTCHMSITENLLFAPGIWGPYKNALVPDFFLHEGGQSATGILIDHILATHPDYTKITAQLQTGEKLHDHLYAEILKLAKAHNLNTPHELTKNFHLYADFHGNRSPVADSTLRGMICGISMHDSIYISYLAIIQALAYSTKHIIDSLYDAGRKKFSTILICGGLSKNKLFVQTNADVCGIPILVSTEPESVLLGSAMLGATASGVYPSLLAAINALSNEAYEIKPDERSSAYHARKYRVYRKMLEDQKEYREIMDGN